MAEGYRDDSELADPARLKATQVIKDLIEALPFPAIANDWQTEEIKCVAMNDHYVENQNCPRDFLLNKNNRVLDPTHLTSLPGSVRVGIRSALAHGFPFDTNFETVMSASPDQKFIKRVSIRMVIVGGFRFILGWQHHLGKDMRYGLSNAEWWTMTALKLEEKAEAEGMESSWVSEESAAQWIAEPTGIFQQTDTLCRKEDLDAAIWKSLDQLSHPVLLCDPFLPECPVIGINKAAQELSGWSAAGSEVTAADAKLLAGAGPLQRGAHHLTYGRYAPGEEEERIAIRTACANGRPCAVGLRGMYSFQSSCSVWLQGVTVAQGVNKGPLGGGMQIWYLVGVLSKEPKEEWATAAPSSAALQAVKAAFQEIMASAEKGLACDTTPFAQTEAPATSAHPYGGDVRFLQETLWHMAKGSD